MSSNAEAQNAAQYALQLIRQARKLEEKEETAVDNEGEGSEGQSPVVASDSILQTQAEATANVESGSQGNLELKTKMGTADSFVTSEEAALPSVSVSLDGFFQPGESRATPMQPSQGSTYPTAIAEHRAGSSSSRTPGSSFGRSGITSSLSFTIQQSGARKSSGAGPYAKKRSVYRKAAVEQAMPHSHSGFVSEAGVYSNVAQHLVHEGNLYLRRRNAKLSELKKQITLAEDRELTFSPKIDRSNQYYQQQRHIQTRFLNETTASEARRRDISVLHSKQGVRLSTSGMKSALVSLPHISQSDHINPDLFYTLLLLFHANAYTQVQNA